MPLRSLGFMVCLFSLVGSVANAESKLVAVEQAPAGLSEKVSAALAPIGQQLVGEDGAVCTIWLTKEIATKPDFKSSLNVKYPFLAGHFVGALRVDKESEFTDFRGQEVPAGVYTLRYAQQPVDGNHIGTSELYDFLLAIPAAVDEDPAPVTAMQTLMMKSAKATGSNHPGIFSLLPPEESDNAPAVIHDESKEFWIMSLQAKSAKGAATPMRIVVVGVSEG